MWRDIDGNRLLQMLTIEVKQQPTVACFLFDDCDASLLVTLRAIQVALAAVGHSVRAAHRVRRAAKTSTSVKIKQSRD